MKNDDFYIGWEGRAAPSIARFARAKVIALIVLAVGISAGIAATQSPFATSRFEFGVERDFEGTLDFVPYPTLLVDRPGRRPEELGASRWLLTVFGKVGAEAALEGLDGHRVKLSGTLIDRDGVTMVEVLPDSVEDLDVARVAPRPGSEPRRVVLRGEIVDSKCYLGVMKPGNLKTHRSCAVRCISGGVPPVLLVRKEDGTARYLLLVDEDGGAINDRILDLVAEPVEISGALSDLGGIELLRTDPATIRRVTD